MSREFTRSEKILVVILAVVLFGLLYDKFVFQTTDSVVQSLKAEADTTQAELDIANAKLVKLEKMEAELDNMDYSDAFGRMESYNNSKRETAFLNRVLADVSDYFISFEEVTRDKEQIRRSFSLQFVTNTYGEAVDVVRDLSYGEYRCLVDDINYSLAESNKIYINLKATFFETMVGGTPDQALPKDESETTETQTGTEPEFTM